MKNTLKGIVIGMLLAVLVGIWGFYGGQALEQKRNDAATEALYDKVESLYATGEYMGVSVYYDDETEKYVFAAQRDGYPKISILGSSPAKLLESVEAWGY